MLWLTLLACQGDGDGDDTDGVTDTEPTAATGDTGTPVGGWTITPEVGPPPLTGVGLAAILTLETDRPCRIEITLDSGAHQRVITPPDSLQSHEWPILGMRADQDYDVTVVAIDDDGDTATATVPWSTNPLPERFPKLDVLTLDNTRTEPGYLLFDADTRIGTDFVLVLDEELEVVWFLETDGHWIDIGLSPQGTLVGSLGIAGKEIDWLGNELMSLTPFPMDPADIYVEFGLHHDVQPRADGGFTALVSRTIPEPFYPIDYDLSGTAPSLILDHGVAQLSPAGVGESILWLGPILDTRRIGYDSLETFGGGMDWAHANGFHELADGSFIVSLRHQDAIVKMDASGGLVWILARPEGFRSEFLPYVLTPVGAPFDYTYHQHSPALDSNGDLVVFDNGNRHRLPYDAPGPDVDYSRVVGYRIDEGAMTVEQLWEYRDTPIGELFADATGDADPQPITGNVLGVFGRTLTIDGVDLDDLGFGDWAGHLIEFDPSNPDPPAMHLQVSSDLADNGDGWAVYRADRIPDFYVWP